MAYGGKQFANTSLKNVLINYQQNVQSFLALGQCHAFIEQNTVCHTGHLTW